MPKALVAMDCRLLVDRGVDVLRAGGCDPVVVVLGAEAEAVQQQAELADCVVVVNADWDTGMASSLRAGLTAAASLSVDAVAVLLVDTPGIISAAVARVLTRPAAADVQSVLAAATYDGALGHPVLLGRSHWSGVAEMAFGETGARPYLLAHDAALMLVPCEDIANGRDVDSPRGATR